MNDNDIIIKISNLKKKFGNFTAVDGISFDIYKGEVFGFLGPNGAGKTTSINMICGLSPPTEGEVIFGNFPIFLFMFFTGAAFPMNGKELFSVAGYSISLQGVMSPTHAVTALKKVLVLNMGLQDIIPEIVALIIITVIYFNIGVWLFQRRHIKVE